MKEGYFIYNPSTILKGTIEEKVFRIEAGNTNVCCGHILVNSRFISSMYYRYYYIMFVKCNYEVFVDHFVDRLRKFMII